MCIIAVSESNKEMTKETFTTCWESNPDGFGMMWVDNGKLRAYKSLSMKLGYDKYKEVYDKYGKETPIVLHFRIGTQGKNDLDNAHPFFVNRNLAFAHNGIISQYSNGYKSSRLVEPTTLSDTRVFNRTILKKLPDGFLDNDSSMYLIEQFVFGDKLVFLGINEKGFTYLRFVNKARGVVDNGFWYSNSSYKSYKTAPKKPVFFKKRSTKTTTFQCEYCGEYHEEEDKITLSHEGYNISVCPYCLSESPAEISDILLGYNIDKFGIGDFTEDESGNVYEIIDTTMSKYVIQDVTSGVIMQLKKSIAEDSLSIMVL